MPITVSGAEELQAALASVTAGDTIFLEPGDYGEVFISGMTFDPPVTIASANPDDMAIIRELDVRSSDGLTFDNLFVDFVPDMDTLYHTEAVRVDDSANITISNCLLQGGDSINGIDPDSEPGTPAPNGILGYPTAKGITIVNGTDITIENCEIADFGRGITFGNVEGFNILNNYIHDTRGSPLTGGGETSDILIEGNHFSTADSWNLGGAGDHADFIHIFTLSSTETPHDNIIIRDNFFEQGDGAAILGIYLDDNGLNQGFTNVIIEDNLLHNGDTQGIRLENVDGALIQNNTLLPTTTDGTREPGIVITDGSSDIQMLNNIWSGIYGSGWDNADANNIVGSGNLDVQNSDINADNYVGNFFTNSQVIDGDLWDFAVIPGSAADGKGASFTQWGALEGETVGYIAGGAWSGLDMKVHTFEMAALIGPEGPVDLAGATITWDFGDGSTNSGALVTHEFDLVGHYTVTATIETADGQVLTVDKAVNVLTAEGVTATFENTFDDLSEIDTPFEIKGSADFVSSDYGMALKLGSSDSAVQYEGTDEMTGNPEYSMSISFSKETLDDTGRLLYFSGTGILIANEDSLYFAAKTDTGDAIQLDARDVGINDTDWHHVTMSYSSETGTATLYLDGEEVAEQTGLTGGQYTPNGQDMSVGGTFGQSFTGLMDNVSFARGAMSAEDVAYLHGTLMGIDVDPPAEDPPAEDPPAEDPPAEDPPAEDPPAEDPPAEDPPAEDPPAEDPPAEDPPAEDPPAEDPPAEDPPAEDPRAEDPPAEDPPAEDDNPRGEAPEPVVDGSGGSFISKLLDIFLSLFGLGSDDDAPARVSEATSESESAIVLEDIVPVLAPLDEALPEDEEDLEALDDLAA